MSEDQIYGLTFRVGADIRKRLRRAAEIETDAQRRVVSVNDVILTAVEEYLESRDIPAAEPRHAQTPRQRVEEIIEDVACRWCVSPAEIKGDARTRAASWARMEIYARIRRELGLSTTHIGRLMNRDHSTVVYGLRRYDELRLAGKLVA